MLPDIKHVKSVLVVDHEDIGDIKFANQKKKAASLKDARRLLLEDNFEAIIFLSLLEEANEIETFVKGLRAHPKLSAMPIFCEYGLMLALPKDLGLIAFEESSLSEDEEDSGLEDDVFNELIETEFGEASIKGDVSRNNERSLDSKIELISEFKDKTAKALVLLELNLEKGLDKGQSREDFVSYYLGLLRQELIE